MNVIKPSGFVIQQLITQKSNESRTAIGSIIMFKPTSPSVAYSFIFEFVLRKNNGNRKSILRKTNGKFNMSKCS